MEQRISDTEVLSCHEHQLIETATPTASRFATAMVSLERLLVRDARMSLSEIGMLTLSSGCSGSLSRSAR